jgi:hypothetical protein
MAQKSFNRKKNMQTSFKLPYYLLNSVKSFSVIWLSGHVKQLFTLPAQVIVWYNTIQHVCDVLFKIKSLY